MVEKPIVKEPVVTKSQEELIRKMDRSRMQTTYRRDYSIKRNYLLYGTTALEELRPPSNEGFFI